MNVTLRVLCGRTMIFGLPLPADYRGHKYRGERIGHDQSIRAGKGEWSADIIKSQTVGLQWSRYGLQNRRWNMCLRARVSERQDGVGVSGDTSLDEFIPLMDANECMHS